MENKFQRSYELLKAATEQPTKENAVALCKEAIAIDEPFEAAAIMNIALRIKLDNSQSFKSILLMLPEWIEWAREYREYVGTVDIEKHRERVKQIIQELELKNV